MKEGTRPYRSSGGGSGSRSSSGTPCYSNLLVVDLNKQEKKLKSSSSGGEQDNGCYNPRGYNPCFVKLNIVQAKTSYATLHFLTPVKLVHRLKLWTTPQICPSRPCLAVIESAQLLRQSCILNMEKGADKTSLEMPPLDWDLIFIKSIYLSNISNVKRRTYH